MNRIVRVRTMLADDYLFLYFVSLNVFVIRFVARALSNWCNGIGDDNSSLQGPNHSRNQLHR